MVHCLHVHRWCLQLPRCAQSPPTPTDEMLSMVPFSHPLQSCSVAKFHMLVIPSLQYLVSKLSSKLLPSKTKKNVFSLSSNTSMCQGPWVSLHAQNTTLKLLKHLEASNGMWYVTCDCNEIQSYGPHLGPQHQQSHGLHAHRWLRKRWRMSIDMSHPSFACMLQSGPTTYQTKRWSSKH